MISGTKFYDLIAYCFIIYQAIKLIPWLKNEINRSGGILFPDIEYELIFSRVDIDRIDEGIPSFVYLLTISVTKINSSLNSSNNLLGDIGA